MRSYVVDESGSVVKLIIPGTEPNPGTYLPVWNGHGDALNLSKLNADGTLTLANSYSYSSWGAPTTATHNAIPDLGFRFLYVGEFDVQWDNAFGLGLQYMHARHYSPALGRFLQPDPDRSDANLYAYAANNPVTELDPDGTCFIVCQLIIVGALLFGAMEGSAEAGRYAIETPRDRWSSEGFRDAAVAGAVSGAIGGAVPGVGRVAGRTVVKAATKILAKVPKAGRAASKIRSGYKKLNAHYEWNNVRARQGPAASRKNVAFPRGREYKELTHTFIPKRANVPNFIKNSRWNLREKWGTNHALSDPSRYRFMPQSWKKVNPLPGPVRRTWSRLWAD